MNKVLIAAFLCLLALPFTACKKSKSETRTELLAKAAWKYDNAGLDTDRNGIADAPVPAGFIQACDMDNTITFNTDGTGIADEGATKCNGSNPQTSPFTWAFKDGEQTINFSNAVFGGLNGDVKVKNITSSQLELHKEVNVGMVVNVIVFLKH